MVFGCIASAGEMVKTSLKKSLSCLLTITLVIAFLPLALVLGGLLFSLVLIASGMVIVGVCFGMSALVWIFGLLMGGVGRHLPWI